MAAPQDDTPARQRIDRWLWHARVVRARTDAAALVRDGHVRVDGQKVTSPGHMVRTGQVLTIALARSVRLLRVTGFAERRGNATSAADLFDEITGE